MSAPLRRARFYCDLDEHLFVQVDIEGDPRPDAHTRLCVEIGSTMDDTAGDIVMLTREQSIGLADAIRELAARLPEGGK